MKPHTPSSKDYRGSREKSEYLSIIRRANEFATLPEAKHRKSPRESTCEPVKCLAFTDHNSVEEFRALSAVQEEVDNLSKLIRERDASNPLVAQLVVC